MTPQNQVVQVVSGWLRFSAAAFRPLTGFPTPPVSVISAVHDDPDLTIDQRDALEELYAAFRDVTREHRNSTPCHKESR